MNSSLLRKFKTEIHKQKQLKPEGMSQEGQTSRVSHRAENTVCQSINDRDPQKEHPFQITEN